MAGDAALRVEVGKLWLTPLIGLPHLPKTVNAARFLATLIHSNTAQPLYLQFPPWTRNDLFGD